VRSGRSCRSAPGPRHSATTMLSAPSIAPSIAPSTHHPHHRARMLALSSQTCETSAARPPGGSGPHLDTILRLGQAAGRRATGRAAGRRAGHAASAGGGAARGRDAAQRRPGHGAGRAGFVILWRDGGRRRCEFDRNGPVHDHGFICVLLYCNNYTVSALSRSSTVCSAWRPNVRT
jgi:hypothetical protein